jgi:heptosyltransferase-2
LLVKPWVSRLFEKDPNIDEIIHYTEAYQGLAGKFRLAREVRKYDFCRALLLQNAFDAAFIAFLAGIPERTGYNRDGRGLLLTKAIPFDDKAKALHHINYYLNLVEKAGFPPVRNSGLSLLLGREDARNRLKTLRRLL